MFGCFLCTYHRFNDEDYTDPSKQADTKGQKYYSEDTAKPFTEWKHASNGQQPGKKIVGRRDERDMLNQD